MCLMKNKLTNHIKTKIGKFQVIHSPSKNFIWYKHLNINKNNKLYLDDYFKERKNFLDFETTFQSQFNIEKISYSKCIYSTIKTSVSKR